MNEMNITNAQYKRIGLDGEIDTISAIIDGKEVNVPLSSSNRHYAEIMRQVNEGTLTIADAE